MHFNRLVKSLIFKSFHFLLLQLWIVEPEDSYMVDKLHKKLKISLELNHFSSLYTKYHTLIKFQWYLATKSDQIHFLKWQFPSFCSLTVINNWWSTYLVNFCRFLKYLSTFFLFYRALKSMITKGLWLIRIFQVSPFDNLWGMLIVQELLLW